MHFVDEVDLVASTRGRVLHVVEHLACVIDLGSRCRVYLNEIYKPPRVDFAARAAYAARVGGHARFTIEALRKNSRDRRLADTAGAGKQKRVMDPPGLERIHQRTPDMLLPNQLGECFGAPGSRQCRICHSESVVPFVGRLLGPVSPRAATLRGDACVPPSTPRKVARSA